MRYPRTHDIQFKTASYEGTTEFIALASEVVIWHRMHIYIYKVVQPPHPPTHPPIQCAVLVRKHAKRNTWSRAAQPWQPLPYNVVLRSVDCSELFRRCIRHVGELLIAFPPARVWCFPIGHGSLTIVKEKAPRLIEAVGLTCPHAHMPFHFTCTYTIIRCNVDTHTGNGIQLCDIIAN